MTAARTASQRGASNRTKGHTAERDVARWLRSAGFPGAERAVRTGFTTTDRSAADPGDIAGLVGVVVSVKNAQIERLEQWLAELDAMDDRPNKAGGEDPVRLLVHKRPRTAPDRWWCWMRAHTAAELLDDAQSAFVFPVRMELGDAVMLLRAAGYGDPIEVAS